MSALEAAHDLLRDPEGASDDEIALAQAFGVIAIAEALEALVAFQRERFDQAVGDFRIQANAAVGDWAQRANDELTEFTTKATDELRRRGML